MHRCTRSACSHSGFSTPSPPVVCTAGLHGSSADGRARQRRTGERAVCACLWHAHACAQSMPVARTACVRYASSTGWGKSKEQPQGGAKARSSTRGQRGVAVCLTSYAASAFINADQGRSSPLGAQCLGGRTLYRPVTAGCHRVLSLSVACSERQGQKVILHLGWSM